MPYVPVPAGSPDLPLLNLFEPTRSQVVVMAGAPAARFIYAVCSAQRRARTIVNQHLATNAVPYIFDQPANTWYIVEWS